MTQSMDGMMATLKRILLCITLLFAPALLAKPSSDFSGAQVLRSPKKPDMIKDIILSEFKKSLNPAEVVRLKKQTLTYSGKAVPALIQVMKSSKFPDKNRWVATFLVGRIMGKKSSPFLAKFLKHPSWIMRMASLKTLLALKEKRFSDAYAKALKDQSFIVRKQALHNIKTLELKGKAANVWSMLYDKRNYYLPKDGQKKRTNLIKEAIKTVGDLKFQKAVTPLLSMAQKEKYEDIFNEIDYSLSKILGKKSPDDMRLKKRYWKKIAISHKTI